MDVVQSRSRPNLSAPKAFVAMAAVLAAAIVRNSRLPLSMLDLLHIILCLVENIDPSPHANQPCWVWVNNTCGRQPLRIKIAAKVSGVSSRWHQRQQRPGSEAGARTRRTSLETAALRVLWRLDATANHSEAGEVACLHRSWPERAWAWLPRCPVSNRHACRSGSPQARTA